MATTQFWSQKLFERRDSLKISYDGVARKCNVSERSAKYYIKRDIDAGYISRKKSQYCHPIFKRLCDGKNIYFLTKKGKSYLGRGDKQSPPSSFSLNNNRKVMYDLHLSLSQLDVDEALSRIKEFPKWWFNDLQLLKRVLQLFFRKLKKGYCVNDPMRWISSVIKSDGYGYRRKIAKEVLKGIKEGRRDLSPPVQQTYSTLAKLGQQGLLLSEETLIKLLRKGMAHLGVALIAFEKLSTYSTPIRDLNGFLIYLVGLDDPLSIFKPKESSAEAIIQETQELLKKHQEKLKCIKSPEELPKTPQKSCSYLQFLIHKIDPQKSLLKHFSHDRGVWKEQVFKVLDPSFRKNTLQLINV
ncbi:MAG: hypothetical protein H6620_08875 [Halobacteriovoraceae bacterium]|nr:hypothetical protein [Halobacteriovoraceae bacterium]